MRVERSDGSIRKDGDAVFAAFTVADGDLVVMEIDIFDAKRKAFRDAEARAIEEERHEMPGGIEKRDDGLGLKR